MNAFLIMTVVVLSFTGGLVVMHVIWTVRMRNVARLNRMLDDARRRGQFERQQSKRDGLEPPTWLP